MIEQIRQGDIPGVQLRFRQLIAAPPADVWPWLTEAARQIHWLAERCELEPGTRDVVRLHYTDADGFPQSERLATVAADPHRQWILDLQNLDGTWPVPTRVVFDLTAMPDGTEISILQTGFAHLPLSTCLTIWETYRHRWRTALSTLATQIATTP